MVYNNSFAQGDMKNILLDVFGTFGTEFIAIIGLVVVVLCAGYLISKVRGK